jgi:hypothetical protein
MYIFCVFTERDRDIADPLILDQWEFYPVLTRELDEILPKEKSTGIASIVRLCAEPYDYASLRDAVLWLMSDRKCDDALHRIEAYKALKVTKNE